MPIDPQIVQQNAAQVDSPEMGKANVPPPGTGADDPYSGSQYDEPVDKGYWISCMTDAERAEKDWRSRGRDIVSIYRNEAKNTGRSLAKAQSGVTFNILFANTEVMLPAIYQRPPQPVVRSRYTSVPTPMVPPPPMMPPGVGPPPPGGMGPPGMPTPPGVPGGPPIAAGPLAGPTAMPPPAAPLGSPEPSPVAGGAPFPVIEQPPPPPVGAFGSLPGAPPPPMPNLGTPAPGRPSQKDIETAASVIEKSLEIVVDDESANEAIKTAIKDLLLPGRGVCRVRWIPTIKHMPLPGGPLPDGTAPTEPQKVWEEVDTEYVFWEDFLCDPVRQAADCNWLAFRHLFTEKQLDAEFTGSPEYDQLKQNAKVGDILRWTDEGAAKSPPGGGSSMKTADKLGDHIRKAMVWEIWDRTNRRVIWFIRESSGIVLRIDPDVLQLKGFYPCPVPLLAVTTSDTRIPRPYYDLYAKLADDLDETSARISALTKQIKVRGLYNAASKEIADLLTAGDQKMLPVDGVDMLSGGLDNHIWLYPINEDVKALQELYIARDQIKQAIYEIMGISDIMRGATKASETATAQRIKGSMGMGRLEDAKQQAATFARDILRLQAEIIAQNFDAETLSKMTGEEVTPEVMSILRDDFTRTCTIDIEADSTVMPDLLAEQEAMTQMMQGLQAIGQMAIGLLGTGILPPPQVLQMSLEMMKLAIRPVRFNRGMMELITAFQDQLEAQIAMQAMMPPAPMMGPPPGPGGPPGAGPQPSGPPGGGKVAPPHTNGAGPPPGPGGMPPPPMV